MTTKRTAGIARINAPIRMPTHEVIDRSQDSASRAYEEVNSDQNKSTLLESAALVAGQINRVAHGLGYVPKGWNVVSCGAPTCIYEHTTSTSQYLDLITLATCTVDMEVF